MLLRWREPAFLTRAQSEGAEVPLWRAARTEGR